MRNRKQYPRNWRKLARACKDRAGWCCERCGVKHGTMRLSYAGNLWPVYLQAAHTKHDQGNDTPELVAVCPTCHWRYYRKPGTRPAWMIERIKHQKLIALAYLV